METRKLGGSRVLTPIAVGLWLAALAVVGAAVVQDPQARSVTPVYHHACERWWARDALYADRAFHYLPQFVALFTPFHALKAPLGDILWRSLAVGLVLLATARFVGATAPPQPASHFGLACLLALGPCLGALRNGQTNLAFAGLCLLLAACLAASRWGLAAACLVGLVAVKPLGLVPALLAPWPYRPLRRPLALGLAALAALPFLLAPPAYALEQYRGAWRHLVEWSGTTENRLRM